MRQSVKRVGYLMVAVLLGLVGMVSTAGTASATRENNVLETATRVQACAFPSGCTRDSRDVPALSAVVTFCVSDVFNLIYSGPGSGRGGFVNRSLLRQPDEQTERCDSGAGDFGRVQVNNANLSSCSGPCVNFGGVRLNDLLGVFCELEGSYLVYVDRTARAGFLETSAVQVNSDVEECNP